MCQPHTSKKKPKAQSKKKVCYDFCMKKKVQNNVFRAIGGAVTNQQKSNPRWGRQKKASPVGVDFSIFAKKGHSGY